MSGLVWMVVVHFSMYGHDIPVTAYQVKTAYTSQKACNMARGAEVAYWETVSYPKPVAISCESYPVRK